MKVSTIKFQLRKNESVERDRSTLKIQWWSDDDYCEKNDSYSVMNTLVDIDCSAQYEPYHISRKRGKGARNGV